MQPWIVQWCQLHPKESILGNYVQASHWFALVCAALRSTSDWKAYASTSLRWQGMEALRNEFINMHEKQLIFNKWYKNILLPPRTFCGIYLIPHTSGCGCSISLQIPSFLFFFSLLSFFFSSSPSSFILLLSFYRQEGQTERTHETIRQHPTAGAKVFHEARNWPTKSSDNIR